MTYAGIHLPALVLKLVYRAFLSFSTERASSATADPASERADSDDTDNFAFAVSGAEFTTSGSRSDKPMWDIDLTDGNGNGMLIAAKSLFLVTGRDGGGASESMRCELLYRVKRIKNSQYASILGQQLTAITQ